MHVISEDKDYVTPVVSKSKLTKSNNISNLTFVVSEYSNVIPSKFKAVKFMLA